MYVVISFVSYVRNMFEPAAVREDTSIDAEVDGEEDSEDEDDHGADTDDDDLNCRQEGPAKQTDDHFSENIKISRNTHNISLRTTSSCI